MVWLKPFNKRSEGLCLTYKWFVGSGFLWWFISATRMHPSSHPGDGCYMPSQIWNGKNCCFCSLIPPANRPCGGPSFCSSIVSYKRVGLPGILKLSLFVIFFLPNNPLPDSITKFSPRSVTSLRGSAHTCLISRLLSFMAVSISNFTKIY